MRTTGETDRLEALKALDLLGSSRLPEFDAVVETLAAIFDCPVALISIVGKDEVWFKAKVGIELDTVPREGSFCQRVLETEDVLVVPDAQVDPRFKDERLVTGPEGIRFYAGKKLTIDGRIQLGTLFVADRRPRTPSAAQIAQLNRLTTVVEGLFKSHQSEVLARTVSELAEAEHRTAVRGGDLLEEVAHVSGVGGWELDLKTNELTWTDKTREIHEVPDDYKPCVENAIAFYAPECRDIIATAVENSIKKGVDWDLELPFITAKGRRIWVRAAGRPVHEDGKVTRLIGAFQDITDRKTSEEAIRHSEAVHRTTLETLREGILLLNRAGEILSYNSAAAALLGYAQKNLKGLNVRHLKIGCSTENGVLDPDLFIRAARNPELVNNYLVKVDRRDGSQVVWLRIDANAADANSGRSHDEVVVSLTDISETKQQAESLRAVFENMPGGMVYYDDDLNLAVSNDDYCRLLNIPKDFVADGPHLRDVLGYLARRGDLGPGDPEHQTEVHFDRFLKPDSHCYERAYKDGKTLEVRGIPLPNGGVVASFFDITERKRSELALKHSEAILRTTLETLREGILLLSRSGQILSCNSAAATLLSGSGADLTEKNVQDLEIRCYSEDGTSDPDLLLRAARAPETVNNFVAKVHVGDGSQSTWLRIDANATQDGDLDEVVVSLADISETKRHSETLQAIFDNVPGGLVYYDDERRLSACNEDFYRLSQIPRELVAKRPHFLEVARFLAERGDHGAGTIDEIVRDRYKIFDTLEPHMRERVTPDGTVLEVRGLPLANGGLIASFHDISERKRVEQAIRHSEAVHRTTLTSLSEGILLLSCAGEIQSANPAAVALLGVATEDLVGRNVAEFDFGLHCEIDGIGDCATPLELAAADPHLVTDLIARRVAYEGAKPTWLRLNAEPIDGDQEF